MLSGGGDKRNLSPNDTLPHFSLNGDKINLSSDKLILSPAPEVVVEDADRNVGAPARRRKE
jgi:hypothetical protein